MDTLIVYYSLEGNCKGIAEHLAQKYGFDTLALKPNKDLNPDGFTKHIKGRMQVILNQQVVLENSKIELEKYANIIIGSPVWMGTYATAIQAFLDEAKWNGQKVAVFTTYDKDCGQVFDKFAQAFENKVKMIGQESFNIETLSEDEVLKRAELWIQSMLDNIQN